jgi:hypothetical protein
MTLNDRILTLEAGVRELVKHHEKCAELEDGRAFTVDEEQSYHATRAAELRKLLPKGE